MQRTSKRECPFCKSPKIIDTGDRIKGSFDAKSFLKPDASFPIYQCSECGQKFAVQPRAQE